MSAPIIVSVQPEDNEPDVILGQAIIVTFDQVIDTTTITDSTFSFTYSPPTQILTTMQMIDGKPISTFVNVCGDWTFATNGLNQTVATFTPDKPLEQNTVYTVTLFGEDAQLSQQNVMNLAGQSMAVSYQWTFTTGTLSFTVPPPQSPLQDFPAIDPNAIKIIPRRQIGDNLSNTIEIIFPGPIDPTSFSMSDLQLCVTPVLNDPNIEIPYGLTYTPTINPSTPNILTINITGWPEWT